MKFVPIPVGEAREGLHPALRALEEACGALDFGGPDELCQRFLECVKELIRSFVEAKRKEANGGAVPATFGAELDAELKKQLAIITENDRYPLPYALGNIVRQLRKQVLAIGSTNEQGQIETPENLLEWIDDCAETNFKLANTAISQHLSSKIQTATKIITYAWCPVVNKVLLDTVAGDHDGKDICILDTFKNGPGIRHLFSLSDYDGYVEYGDLSAVGCVFQRASLVLLGCSAVLSSGRVLVPRGSVQIALVAKAHCVPVLVLAPTYKFVDKAQASSRMALLGRSSLLELLPADLISAIVTDIRLLPPSSAPAVLRAKALDDTTA